MSEVERLKQENLKLRAALEDSESERKRLHIEIEALRYRLDLLSRRVFGHSSEKLDKDQLEFLFANFKDELGDARPEDLDSGREPERPKRRPAQAPEPRSLDKLEVIEKTLIPENVAALPEAWHRIGEDKADQLDYIPAKFVILRTIRPKYVPADAAVDTPPIQHPAPPRLIERGFAAPGLLAHLLISKYGDHLPCHRLEKIFKERHGVPLSRQQISQWVGRLADEFGLVVESLRSQIKKADYLQVDETPITFLDRDRPRGSAKGYLWTYLIPGEVVVYDWKTGRGADALSRVLGSEYEGAIQCDGYQSYDAYGKANPKALLIGCFAHARRKFENAKEQDPERASEVLGLIAKLYALEKEMRKAAITPTRRHAIRLERALPIAHELKSRLEAFQQELRRSPAISQAVNYTLSQWPKLERVFERGEAELDTNLVENAIRPTAVGKKNWLFIGHRNAGQRAGNIYSLIQTCRLQGVEPMAYLKSLIEELPHATNQTVHTLTPMAWKARQTAKS